MGILQACPHCGYESDDAFEVLNCNVVHAMCACEGCGKPYSFALMDCVHCGFEEVLTQAAPIAPATLSSLECPACRQYFMDFDRGQCELL